MISEDFKSIREVKIMQLRNKLKKVIKKRHNVNF